MGRKDRRKPTYTDSCCRSVRGNRPKTHPKAGSESTPQACSDFDAWCIPHAHHNSSESSTNGMASARKSDPEYQDHASLRGQCDNPALGKLLQFKPRRTILKLLPRLRMGACPKCGHKKAVHVIHPSGMLACEARRCLCRIKSWLR
jgi:hypothetical protein